MFRVTADSNIYISALQFGGLPRQFLNAARRRKRAFQLATSPALLEELQGVLRKKFGWTEAMLKMEHTRMARFVVQVNPTETINVVEADPDDDRVLECAVAAKCRFIVTGDKHLLDLGQYRNIQIVKLADFMRLWLPLP